MSGFNINMRTKTLHQQVNFGQKVPTEYLLKAALKKIDFTEAKALNQSIGVQYSGHIGFHKRALVLAENACKHDDVLQQIVSRLSKIANEKELNNEIKRIADCGEMTDIII